MYRGSAGVYAMADSPWSRALELTFILNLVIYMVGFVAGFTSPNANMLESTLKSFSGIEDLPLFHRYVFIAVNNIALAFILVVSSSIVIPGLAIIAYNGYVLGTLTALWLHVDQPIWRLLMLILPHGIIELTALFYTSSIGLSIAVILMSNRKREGIIEQALASLPIAVYLLLLAAAVEVLLTPRLASSLI